MSRERATPRAYLLLHGLTASPMQFVEFGRQLYERGSNVFIPRLPHHGLGDRLTTALDALTADELRRTALEAVTTAGGLGEEVHVVGFSLGGLLAAWIGQLLGVASTTSIAPFLGVPWLPRRSFPGVAELALRMPNRYLWWNPLLGDKHGLAHGYPRFPTHAVARSAELTRELFEAAATGRPAAGRLRIVVNASETAVSNRAARYLAWLWSRTAPERTSLFRLKGLGASHDIIETMEAPQILARVYPPLVRLVDR